jgi:hypothetical protein
MPKTGIDKLGDSIIAVNQQVFLYGNGERTVPCKEDK